MRLTFGAQAREMALVIVSVYVRSMVSSVRLPSSDCGGVGLTDIEWNRRPGVKKRFVFQSRRSGKWRNRNGMPKTKKMEVNVIAHGGRDVQSGVVEMDTLNGDAKVSISDATITSHLSHIKLLSGNSKEEWTKRACWLLFLLPLSACIGTTTRAALATNDGVVLGGEIGVKGYGLLRVADYDM